MSEHTTASESTITEGPHQPDPQPQSRTLKAPALIPVNSSSLGLLADSDGYGVEGELDGVYSSNDDGGSDSQGTLAIEEKYYHRFSEPAAIPGDHQNPFKRKTIGDCSRGRKYEGIYVLDERNVRDGKGEVRKQYLVQHWVDAKDINACKLPRKSTTS
ncbi:hypothetical protein MMC17_009529 [Xylographa soralifera]|nr:hypothetical protein [Xylographa soralifera]